MLKMITNPGQYFAVRSYKNKLPQQLRTLYGKETLYTPTQITMAIRKAGLSTKYRKLAYQMYVPNQTDLSIS